MAEFEPTRVEVDLPIVIVNQYGKLVLDNHKDVEDVVGTYFTKGDVLSVHLIVETTGQTRGFCDFVDPSATYRSICGQVLTPSGVCWLESEHEKRRVKQLELVEAESE